MTDRRLTQYVEECGSLCPDCREGSPVRSLGHVAKVADGELPAVEVACHCGRCPAEWVEVYRLESARAMR